MDNIKIKMSSRIIENVKANSNRGVACFLDENYLPDRGEIVCNIHDLNGVSGNLSQVIEDGMKKIRRELEELRC